jgi:DNA-binding CsgD family transcriptional regulator
VRRSLVGVLDLVRDVSETRDAETFADRALGGLADLVPSDEITFNDIDFARRSIRFVRTIPEELPTDDDEYFFDHWQEIPLCWGADPGAPGISQNSDVIGQAALRRLEVHNVLMRPLDHTMKVSFAAPRLTSRAFMLSRVGRGYSDGERDLLALLLPHLDAAYRRVRLAARLTEREHEVLSLVADGMTNREIAEALYLSPLTVRTHLEHIFVKLGVRTRTAAASLSVNGQGRSASAGI